MTATQVMAGVAVVLAVEGMLYALLPGGMRQALTRLAAASDEALRWGGIVAAVIGVALAWLLTAS
ncbi:DUF2065 domain-containing protein [Acetobacteraceae bacterium H6797]|nr:DUF2065 domain-containing protein [Acetobacteraceae bacterium H6797]